MKSPAIASELMGDEIIAEVRSIREALAAQYDYDLDLLFEAAKRKEGSTDRKRIKASPKRLSPSGSA